MSTSPSRRCYKVKRGKKEEYIKDERLDVSLPDADGDCRHDY